jgi:serine/threonine protein kinase
MTPEKWKNVDRLYLEALEQAPDDRAAFLRDACNGDEEIRAEVESLLEYQPHARDFIETPAEDAPHSPVTDAIARIRASLAPGRFVGAVVGAYDLESLIAAGGMGEVYRARDTRLDRIVAIKILPEHFADDPARRDRFHREARIISSLNHPHICALYDVGVHDGAQYLVMEYVEGETLHDRIRRGPVPVAEALDALIQIVDALDKAHRRGIVHRDLTPGNIMWARSGIKLLDFGLAARRSPGSSAGDDVLATGRSDTLTAEGTIIGTMQYMAPEQLQGLSADARTDIFAFGAVAYEMLTASHAFKGNSRAALIGAILRDEPQPIAELVPEIPVALARTLSRCVAKQPDERWQTANDLLFQLRSLTALSVPVAVMAHHPKWSPWIERGLWFGLAVAAAVVGAIWFPRNEPPRSEGTTPFSPVVFSVSPARGTSLADFFTPFAISPDGKYLAYVAAGDDGVRQLWLRSLDSEHERQLPGTEGAGTPFWSPDSQWIGFFAARSLKKARVSTGVTQTIASDVVTVGGASWGVHGDIIFPGRFRGLMRVSANDGRVSRVTVEPGNQFSPQFLSDGRHFIYTAHNRSAVAVAHVDGGAPRTVMTFSVGTSSLGYSRGSVFFVQDGALFARAFDEQRFKFTGEARQLLTGIPAGLPARSPFSVSASGVLAYWTNPLGVPAALSWFNRAGRSSPAVATPARYKGLSLTPDGERLAFARIAKTGAEDLWLHQVRDHTERQITFDAAAFMPLWSPDATRVAFSGFAVRPPPNVYVKSIRNDGAAAPVGGTPFPTFATSWTPDGLAIVIGRAADLSKDNDLWSQPLAGGPAERLWFNTPANEMQGRVSPDGRWILYTTDGSGSSDVWVASYPSGVEQHPVSRAGGDFPQWGTNELFFISSDRQVMAASVTPGASGLQIGVPQSLFRIPTLVDIDPLVAAASNPFVATSDGQRFLVAQRAHDPDAAPITVVVNWPALLKR